MSGRKIIEGLQEAVELATGPRHWFGSLTGVDLVAEAITEAFGERCPDFEPGCYCCQAWAQYDALRPGASPKETQA